LAGYSGFSPKLRYIAGPRAFACKIRSNIGPRAADSRKYPTKAEGLEFAYHILAQAVFF